VFDASFVPGPRQLHHTAGRGIGQESKSGVQPPSASTPDLESRRPAADHQTLELIASSTGGSSHCLDRLEEVLATIADRSLLIPDDVEESLWDSKLVLLLFVLLIGSEWALRAFGLL
jgi:hypothetical protein